MLRPEHFIYETDPQKQDIEWANKVITRRRTDWRPVVDTLLYKRMKTKLLSAQNMDDVKQYFDDEDFLKNITFQPLPVMEKPRNIIIEKAREAGLKPYIQSIDPTAKKHKEQDLFRLMTKQTHTASINKARATIGDGVPYRLNEKDFNGNVEEFDKLGLNPGDQSEVQFFFDTYYKLNYEGYAQNSVQAYLGVNKAEDDIPRYCIDAMAVKVQCKQTYVSPASGQIVVRYLQPNQTYAIFGSARDASDAAVRGWERQITVMELIQILGKAFNFERDWLQLIQAVNYGSGTQFDGFIKNGISYNNFDQSTGTDDQEKDKQLSYLNFDDMFTDTYNYKVYFGYIEWEQPCVHTEKINKITGQRFTVLNDFVPSEKSQYLKEEWGYFVTKTSNYIATGSQNQKLYGYGNLYMAQREGQCDEYSAGSISIIREEGLSATAIAELYIDIANYAYYKMLWAIHRSKPDVWSWAYESIRDIAMKMNQSVTSGTNTPQKAGGFGDAINNLIDQFDKKLFMMHTMPIVDGQVVGGGGLQHQKIPGALDQIAIQLREMVVEWAEKQIGDKLGLEGIAAASAPSPRDGLKLNQLYLQQSKTAIAYIQRMTDASFRHTAKLILQYIQDILNFPGTIPYNYLLNLVGDDAVQALKSIGNEAAPHRFAIYATSISVIPEKAQMMEEATIAFNKGLLSFAEYQLIKNIEEPIIAAKQSAFFQEKAEKRKEKQQQQANEFAMAMSDKKDKNKFDLEKMIADSKILQERIRTNGYIYQADKAAESKIEVKKLGDQNTAQKQETKVDQQKQMIQDKATIDLGNELINEK